MDINTVRGIFEDPDNNKILAANDVQALFDKYPGSAADIADFIWVELGYNWLKNAKEIPSGAFNGINVVNSKGQPVCVIPDNITKIGKNTFNNCANLTAIQINGNVSELPSGFCNGCTSLTRVIFSKNTPSFIKQSNFKDCDSVQILLPKNSSVDSISGVANRSDNVKIAVIK